MPVYARGAGVYRWPCPVCGGGFGDPFWRPLVLVDARGDAADDRLCCEASIEHRIGRPTCHFTLARLVAALAPYLARGSHD